jgi:aspartyl-tRNA(Asn)/glutamyl-tRNA(Gln) amidotransferase subunit B
MVSSGEISGKTAKEVLDYVWQNPDANPRKFVEERGLRQVTDMGAIETAVDQVIAANPDKVDQAKAKPALAGWFVGQVMKATGGKASPQAVNDLVKKKLGIA